MAKRRKTGGRLRRTFGELHQIMFSRCYLDNKTGCWIYTGHPAARVPQIRFNGKKHICSRMSYLMHKGPIPKGLHVCHTCDNPRCLNPEHLFLGTNQDNMNDKVKKGRQVKGESVNTAKLSRKEVLSIRRRLSNGEAPIKIAKDFPVTRDVISKIGRGLIWKHVTITEEYYG